jgi:hypothetical protein
MELNFCLEGLVKKWISELGVKEEIVTFLSHTILVLTTFYLISDKIHINFNHLERRLHFFSYFLYCLLLCSYYVLITLVIKTEQNPARSLWAGPRFIHCYISFAKHSVWGWDTHTCVIGILQLIHRRSWFQF